MNAARAFQRCCAALSILGVTSYITATFSTFEPALGITLVGLPAIATAWWLNMRRGLTFPRWVVNGLLMLAVAYAAMRASSSRVTVEVIAELVVFIEFIKLGDRRTPRDDSQIISLTVFLGIAAMLTSNDLWVGLQLIAFIPLLIATVMLFQIYSGWHAAGRPEPPPTIRTRASFRWTVGLATAGTLSLTLFVFIIMPRGVGEDFLGNIRLASAGARTGFTDHVKLGTGGLISQSPRIVLDLEVHQTGLTDDDIGPNLGGSDTVFYLRGAVLSEDSGQPGTWTVRSPVGRTMREVPSTEDVPLIRGVRAPIRQDITIRNADPNRGALFAQWRPIKFRAGHAKFEMDPVEGTIRRTGSSGLFQYTVWSTPADLASLPPPERTPVGNERSGRVRDLAVRLLTGAGIDPDPATRPLEDDARAARIIQDHLQQNYRYTLEAQAVPSRNDPVEQFLFQTSEGHCEYFAAAMVRMCRSVGINARMIAGYIAAEYTESTGRYTVRESNAHAWVEVEAGTDRWRRFDPTPPADLARLHRGRTGLLARLRQAVESVEYAWNTGVVSFDEGARQRLLGPSEGRRAGLMGLIDALGSRLQVGGWRTFLRAVAAGISVFLLVWLLGTGTRWTILRVRAIRELRRRERIPALAALSPARRAQLRFYIRHLDLLRRRGHAKPDWKPPLVHAQAVSAANRPLGDQSARLSAIYYSATFGARDLSEGDAREAERLLESMESAGS